MMSFVIGQRWISDTESDLGLGLIYAFDQRTVTLYFPAIGESRVYSRENPPITRIIFADDDTITSFEGWDMRITGHLEDNGIITYLGQRSDYPEQTVELNEKHIDSKMSYSKPQLRLFSGQIDRNDHYAMRYRANLYRQRQFSNPDSGLCGMRTSLIPHQLYIANEVAHRHAPRVLLADEVGLGKTIEAGMIIHQRLLSGSSERVLIIVPSSLQHQWLVEMLRRFNLYFSLFDEERLNEALLDDIHAPFDTEQLVICSLDFVTQETRRLNYLLKSHWDLLVVDEAHHLQWSPEAPSEQYTAIEHLANHIPAILLLTATPEQLGLESHFARLRLLDPARFHDYVEFLKEQDQFKVIADAVDSLLAQTNLTDEQCNNLTELISEQDIEPLLQSANSDSDDKKQARAQLTKILMDRHGTSRILFRNTRQAIKGFPTRNLHQIKLPLPTEYQSLIEFTQNMSHDDISAKSVRLQLFPEQLYLTFNSKSEIPWYDIDPRVNWVINHLLQHRDKKILIICHLAKTALALEQALREKEGIKATVFHEGLSILERDRAAAYFASQEEGAQVMICSEIGSEGRNFQFSHTMIMFDLPLNPDLLEQRIGRLDRIGQCHDIDIYVPYLENSAQAALLRWYEESLNAFESTCPTGIILFDHYFETLLPFISGMLSKEKCDNFISQCQQHHLQLKQQLESGRDRLLELNSNGGELALQLAERIDENDDDKELEIFSQQLFNLIGLHQNDDKDGLINLIPSSDMLIPDFPGIPEDGCTISFERQQALSLEDTQFITWEHPIIRHGIDLLVSGDIGRCSVSLLKNKSLPVGTLLIELIYILNVQAPKSLQLQRFLPPTPLRLLLDASGRNLANNVDFEKLHQQLTPIKRNLATNIAKTVRTQVEVIIEKAEKTVQPLAQTCIDEAKSKAEQSLHEELSRLQSLKAVNPSIRDDEITAIEENLKDVLEHLEQANWYLDSLRLIVVSHQ